MPCLFACLWFGSAKAADLRTEVFELSRPASPVAALLKPLLGEGEVATAMEHTLVIRARPEKLNELKLLIDRLDAPVHTLLVSVRIRQRAQASGPAVMARRSLARLPGAASVAQ